jgi:N-acetyl sugar amidotransferase
MSQRVFWCTTCLNMSTRPRIEFDAQGSCSACQWSDEKRVFDFGKRKDELRSFLNENKAKDGHFDCVVPVSGGKDGSYVAHTLKTQFGLTPLTVTIRPALELELGGENLRNFIESGFNHVHVSPDAEVMRVLNREGFIEKGFPYYGWLIAIHTAVIRTAFAYNVPLIFYGEDGEVEYGGSQEHKNRAFYGIDYMKNVYLEGGYERVLAKAKEEHGFTDAQLYFWKFPTDEEVIERNLKFTHWSYYEAWDSYRNYVIAKEHCGLKEKEETNAGTFTNFSQNDQALYSLHAYLMYLKFGFGRATQDAGIEIRRGAMDRDQALNLVKLYDNMYPEEFEQLYLDYYQMTQSEFDAVLDKWVNEDLFEKIEGRWSPKFTAGEDFEI